MRKKMAPSKPQTIFYKKEKNVDYGGSIVKHVVFQIVCWNQKDPVFSIIFSVPGENSNDPTLIRSYLLHLRNRIYNEFGFRLILLKSKNVLRGSFQGAYPVDFKKQRKTSNISMSTWILSNLERIKALTPNIGLRTFH